MAYQVDSGLVEAFRRGMESVGQDFGIEVPKEWVRAEVRRFEKAIAQPKPLTRLEEIEIEWEVIRAGWTISEGWGWEREKIVENGRPMGKFYEKDGQRFFRWLTEEEIEQLEWEEAWAMDYEDPSQLPSSSASEYYEMVYYEARRPGQNWQPIEAIWQGR